MLSFLSNYSLHSLTLLSCFWLPQFPNVYLAMFLRIELARLNSASFVETNYFFAVSQGASVYATALSVQHAIV